MAEHRSKSSGSEHTFARDLTDVADMRSRLDAMAREAASWLTRRDLFARTVVIKVRYHDFTTITRSDTAPPTRDADRLAARAVALLERTEAGPIAVRLLGVSVHNLCDTDAPAPPTVGRDLRLPFDP